MNGDGPRKASIKETGEELPQTQWKRFEEAVDADERRDNRGFRDGAVPDSASEPSSRDDKASKAIDIERSIVADKTFTDPLLERRDAERRNKRPRKLG